MYDEKRFVNLQLLKLGFINIVFTEIAPHLSTLAQFQTTWTKKTKKKHHYVKKVKTDVLRVELRGLFKNGIPVELEIKIKEGF